MDAPAAKKHIGKEKREIRVAGQKKDYWFAMEIQRRRGTGGSKGANQTSQRMGEFAK